MIKKFFQNLYQYPIEFNAVNHMPDNQIVKYSLSFKCDYRTEAGYQIKAQTAWIMLIKEYHYIYKHKKEIEHAVVLFEFNPKDLFRRLKFKICGSQCKNCKYYNETSDMCMNHLIRKGINHYYYWHGLCIKKVKED